jgi:peptidoglycan/LPS O-acetylase OafA/YrhL
MQSSVTLPVGRQPFLDFLRVAAFGLLVLYHVGMYYVSWDWHVKSPHAGAAIEPWMRLLSPWRMDLLFLISGAATAYLLARSAGGPFLGARLKRLGLPLLVGLAVIVPPQPYFEVVEKAGYSGSYFDFLGLYFSAYGGFCRGDRCLILPTWNHLWFLPYVILYTVLLAAALRWRPALLDALARALPGRLSGARLIWVPIVLLVLNRWLLRDRFPPNHALWGDWFLHAQSAAMFVFGAAAARSGALWPRFEQWRLGALLAALAAWGLLVDLGKPGASAALDFARPWIYSTLQWCALIAVLGFAHRHVRRDRPWLRRLSEAVFPVYLLHQTVTIVLTRVLAPFELSPLPEATLLAALTFAIGAAVYLAVRPFGWLRPWFGLAPATSAKNAASLAGSSLSPLRTPLHRSKP